MTRAIMLHLPDWCIDEIDRIAAFSTPAPRTREEVAATWLETALHRDAYIIRVAPWAADIIRKSAESFDPPTTTEIMMQRWLHADAAQIRDKAPEVKGATDAAD